MVKRFDPQGSKDRLGFRISGDMDESKFGGFVQFSDYEELRERLACLLRWCHRIDGSNLDDYSLSDFDTDVNEAKEFLENTYA